MEMETVLRREGVGKGRAGVASNEGGFSIVELAIAMAVMSFMMLIVYISAQSYMRKAHTQSIVEQVGQVQIAVISHYGDYGVYPRDFGDLTEYIPASSFGANAQSGSPLGTWKWLLSCNADGNQNSVLELNDVPLDIRVRVADTLIHKYNQGLVDNGGVFVDPVTGAISVYFAGPGQATCRDFDL